MDRVRRSIACAMVNAAKTLGRDWLMAMVVLLVGIAYLSSPNLPVAFFTIR